MSSKRSAEASDFVDLSSEVKTSKKDEELNSCVILCTDGSFKSELLGPYTESFEYESAYFDSPALYLGGWDDIGVHLVGKLADQDDESAPLNTHKLQPPHHNKSFRGDIIVFKIDEAGLRVSYSVSDYEEFLKEEIEEWEEDDIDAENIEDDAIADYLEDDLDADGALGDGSYSEFYKTIHSKVKEFFSEKWKREVTEEESELVSLFMDVIEQHISLIDEQEEVDTDQLLSILTEKLEASFEGREITETERELLSSAIQQTIQMLTTSGDNALIDEIGDYGLENDIEINQDFVQYMANELSETFRSEHNRSPNADEQADIMERAVRMANDASGEEGNDDEEDEIEEDGDDTDNDDGEDGSGDEGEYEEADEGEVDDAEEEEEAEGDEGDQGEYSENDGTAEEEE